MSAVEKLSTAERRLSDRDPTTALCTAQGSCCHRTAMTPLPPRACAALLLLLLAACAPDPPPPPATGTAETFEPAPMPFAPYRRAGSPLGSLQIPIPPRMPAGTGAVPVGSGSVRGSIVSGVTEGF